MIFVADETHHCRSPESNSSENETIARTRTLQWQSLLVSKSTFTQFIEKFVKYSKIEMTIKHHSRTSV